MATADCAGETKISLTPIRHEQESAGLRMVVVNLRIDSKQTRILGIETHVCELQLVLRQVVEKQVIISVNFQAT